MQPHERQLIETGLTSVLDSMEPATLDRLAGMSGPAALVIGLALYGVRVAGTRQPSERRAPMVRPIVKEGQNGSAANVKKPNATDGPTPGMQAWLDGSLQL